MKSLFVAGNFNDKGGKSSKIAHQIFEAAHLTNPTYENGGHFSTLESLIDSITDFNLVFWFANVPNDKSKVIQEVKKRNKQCVLVTSKRNVEKHYDFQGLIYHAFNLKTNLAMEVTKSEGTYFGRVFDPLSNVFLDYTSDFSEVGRVLGARAQDLLRYTRVASRKVGDVKEVPNESEFFAAVQHYAHAMHSIVHVRPEAVNRFLGNASFRHNDQLYISQRNVDKRIIDTSTFVAVSDKNLVSYYGDNKPSVDSPIQITLFNHYKDLRYMLHAHAYIEGAPFTQGVMPCGALEEAQAIIDVVPSQHAINFPVNIRGHGSLMLVDTVSALEDIPFYARPIPEVHEWI